MKGTKRPHRRADYKVALRALQIELVKVQKHVIKHGHKVLVIFEGRDASGKDGAIKRIVQHLSPRETRVVALGKPSDKDRTSWYFQRYASYLPAAQELVLFNRSWYNRAGVERVMDFCTDAEYESFMKEVIPFEHMLIGAGIQIMKYYLDISKKEQKKRLRDRRENPLTQWKTSPIDEVALKRWEQYTEARDRMLAQTSSTLSPWIIVRADDKRVARLNVIRDLIARLACRRPAGTLPCLISASCFRTMKRKPTRDGLQHESTTYGTLSAWVLHELLPARPRCIDHGSANLDVMNRPERQPRITIDLATGQAYARRAARRAKGSVVS